MNSMQVTKMKSENLIPDDINQDLTFEVSKNFKVTTKLNYKKGEVIDYLVREIQQLRTEINILKNKNILTTKESLIDLWDNDYDDKWNEC